MSYTLRKGDEGQEVKRLQTKLTITADGDFGPKTAAAVKAHQAKNALTQDGIAGQKTLTSLKIPVLSGVDLSAWNGKNIDFCKLANSHVQFAWVKITEGTTHVNPGHEKKVDGCRKNDIITGVYHFGRPDTYSEDPSDAKQEADNFLAALNKVGLLDGDLVPALDIEAGLKTGDQHNVDWNLEWLEIVSKETGVKPIVYTAKWAVDLFLKKASHSSIAELTKYPLWWASYNDGPEPKRVPKLWDNWDVWQWTSKGTISGVKGKCDRNWLAGGQLEKLRV